MSIENTKIVLASRPKGLPEPENFRIEKEPVPELKKGQVLIKVLYLSLDPYMRGRMSEEKSYADPVPIDGVMTGESAGVVIESRSMRFTKGDYVEVAGVAGTVNEVRIFSTILTTPDNKLIIIPNGQVAADTITNYSANDQRRVDMVFGVGYDDDLKLAREVLTRICVNHPKVLDDPETKIFVMNLGDSSVDFAVRPWANSEDYWTVKGDLLEQAKVELEAAGCNIPYPQTDVHLHHQNPVADFLKG